MLKNVIVTALAVAWCASTVGAAERTKELGMVNYYAKYEAFKESRTKSYGKSQNALFANLKEMGCPVEWVDVDIFLPAGKTQRDACKRILIPAMSDTFTLEMYRGMEDYVKSGGLLVTQVSCVIVDTNSNYKHDAGDKTHKYPAKTFLGVYGAGGGPISAIKAVKDSPLTKGIALDEWITLEKATAGRTTRNLSADVVALCRGKVKGEEKEMPFLTAKSHGKGACVYLVGYFWGPGNGKTMTQLVKNILSAETLAALCAP